MSEDKVCDICGKEKNQGYKTLSLSGFGDRREWDIRHRECARKVVNSIRELQREASE